ncbi:hypothetical protein G7Z17_g1334 [Cylindrodendrum hubeiense]|uniref:Uncharacterized protein n=1 Tax=Cylindrodendrum hubeiense TaxID=595255 RepID=A0A9P5LCK1_9HYPO|nr:hypothetical protein G7Z17_g1334 [Cylindrodendrum hubeiense]
MPETLSQQKELDIKDYAQDGHVETGVGTVHPVMKVYGGSERIEYTNEENKRVKRKIDLILLPLMCICYIFSFLDKTLLNYASIFGIKEALHLEGSDYSWLGSIFYIGYMIGSMVWSRLVHRWPGHAGKFISGAVCTWSVIVLLTRTQYPQPLSNV